MLDSTKGTSVAGRGSTTDFPLVEKGYDPSQVDEYLTTQMLQLREEAVAAKERIAELEAQVASAKEAEDALHLTMVMVTRARNELLDQAKTEADDIIGGARRHAFVLMTEASNDADGTVDEGKAIIATARDEALSVISDVEEETARLIAGRDEALAKMRSEYEIESTTLMDRINTLRSIADDLAAKVDAPETTRTSPDRSSAHAEERTADSAPQAKNVPDHEEDEGDTLIVDRIRGSFSGRRSAKLPRIGEEAGRSALAAASAMRAHLTHEPDDSPPLDESDLAARTA